MVAFVKWTKNWYNIKASGDLAKLVFLGKAGEKPTVEVTTDTNGFVLGMNQMRVSVKNVSAKEQKLTQAGMVLVTPAGSSSGMGKDGRTCYALRHENFGPEDVEGWKSSAERILETGGARHMRESEVAE